MDINLKITDQVMREAVVEAIMVAITPEARNTMIQAAIRELMVPDAKSYDKRSTVERCFGNAVAEAARQEANKAVEDSTIRAKVIELITEAASRVFATGERREKLVTKIADAIGEAVCGRGY